MKRVRTRFHFNLRAEKSFPAVASSWTLLLSSSWDIIATLLEPQHKLNCFAMIFTIGLVRAAILWDIRLNTLFSLILSHTTRHFRSKNELKFSCVNSRYLSNCFIQSKIKEPSEVCRAMSTLRQEMTDIGHLASASDEQNELFRNDLWTVQSPLQTSRNILRFWVATAKRLLKDREHFLLGHESRCIAALLSIHASDLHLLKPNLSAKHRTLMHSPSLSAAMAWKERTLHTNSPGENAILAHGVHVSDVNELHHRCVKIKLSKLLSANAVITAKFHF